MRAVVFCLVASFIVLLHVEDKNEEKVREVADAYLKAIIAKDFDAVMKTVDVPFVFAFGSSRPRTADKTNELKDDMTMLLKDADPKKVTALKVEKVYDMPGLAKYAKEKAKDQPEEAGKYILEVEKVVGKSGYVMLLRAGDIDTGVLLVRFKDGKAFVVGMSK